MTKHIEELRQEWEALTPDEQAAEVDDYQFQIISSHHDAAEHHFHPILSKEN